MPEDTVVAGRHVQQRCAEQMGCGGVETIAAFLYVSLNLKLEEIHTACDIAGECPLI